MGKTLRMIGLLYAAFKVTSYRLNIFPATRGAILCSVDLSCYACCIFENIEVMKGRKYFSRRPQFGRPRAMAVDLQMFIKFGPGGRLKWLAIAS